MPPVALTEDSRRILHAAIAVLDQGETLLQSLEPAAFARKNSIAFNASIGGHYRHCLDHFTSVVNGFNGREIDYDHRERNARIEAEPDFALEMTRQLRAALEKMTPEMLDAPLIARCEVSYEPGDSPRTHSSGSRELVYAIAHAIHHFALIAIMARIMQVELPPHFGVAPSTVAHQAALHSAAH